MASTVQLLEVVRAVYSVRLTGVVGGGGLRRTAGLAGLQPLIRPPRSSGCRSDEEDSVGESTESSAPGDSTP